MLQFAKKTAYLIMAYIACCSLSSASTLHWQNSDFILNSFFEVALGSEYSEEGQFIRKWRKPIRYYFDHQVGDTTLHENLFNKQVRHLQRITGHRFYQVNTAAEANVTVHFMMEKNFRDVVAQGTGISASHHVNSAICLASFHNTSAGVIHKGAVYIPIDRARAHGQLVACMVEEITQVMGLPRDSDNVFPSVFNDRSTDVLLSGLDDILLRLLYDPRVKSGMTRRQLLPVLTKIIQEYQRSGIILDAHIRVKQESELHQLLFPY